MSTMQEVEKFLALQDKYNASREAFLNLMWPAILFAGLSSYYDKEDCIGIKWEAHFDKPLAFKFSYGDDVEKVTIPYSWLEAEDLKSSLAELRRKEDSERAQKYRDHEIVQLKALAERLGFSITEKELAVPT